MVAILYHASVKLGPVKTNAGQRDLPLLGIARQALVEHRRRQQVAYVAAGDAWPGAAELLIFTTASGHAVEPQNLVRSFRATCKRFGLRRITLHQLRHTQATLLEALGVSAREAQLILGHAHVSTTQQIYTHPGMETRRTALECVEQLFLRTTNSGRCRQLLPSTPAFVASLTSILSGGPGYTFLKPSEVDELIADLVLLHSRLVELGMEYRNGEVCLADLEARDV